MKRQTETDWNCHEVADMLQSSMSPEQGWVDLVNEANKRISALQVALKNAIGDMEMAPRLSRERAIRLGLHIR